MKLDDITRLWKLQDERIITITDSDRLVGEALGEQRRANRRHLLENLLKVAAMLTMATVSGYRGLTGPDMQLTFYNGAVASVGIGLFIAFATWRQRRRERLFDESLRGQLRRALSQLDFSIWLDRNSLWYAMLPILFICLVGLVEKTFVKEWSLWWLPVYPIACVAVGCGFAWWVRKGAPKLSRQRARRDWLAGIVSEMDSLADNSASDRL